MKSYLRILASSTVMFFGLSLAGASAHQAAATQTATSTDTSTTKSKRKSRKSTDATASTPAAADATSATASSSTGKTGTRKAPAPVNNASDADIAAAKSSGKVWVNTESKVYHKGGQWYGKTKKGQFMTEDDAKKAGYHESKNESGAKKS